MHQHHLTGMLGAAGALTAGASHWFIQQVDGLTHVASIIGVWVGTTTAIISLIRVVRSRKRK